MRIVRFMEDKGRVCYGCNYGNGAADDTENVKSRQRQYGYWLFLDFYSLVWGY